MYARQPFNHRSAKINETLLGGAALKNDGYARRYSDSATVRRLRSPELRTAVRKHEGPYPVLYVKIS